LEIQKQNTLKEAEEPKPELEKRATTVTKLTAGYDVTEGVIKVSEDVGMTSLKVPSRCLKKSV
jgi:hypothetical protein